MNQRPIYLDNCATTKIDENVLATMTRYFAEDYGNAASTSHSYGWDAQSAVEAAAADVATAIGGKPTEIIFTSGATESNNLAITGLARANRNRGQHIITCVTEHKSVLDTCRALEDEGFEVTYLPVDATGRISLDQLRESIRVGQTILVSLMWVNNETGTLQPVAEVAEICQRAGVRLHVDATQAVGKVAIDVSKIKIDLLSLSAHKIHGPKGIGALYVRRDLMNKVEPIIHGGRHQRGLRSGTLPVPLIAGLGIACRNATEQLEARVTELQGLRDRLEQAILTALPETIVHGDPQHRSPIVSNLGFQDVDGEALLVELSEIAVSAGSACTSASGLPSYVLLAMGVEPEIAKSSLRLSISHFTTEAEIDRAAQFLIGVVQRLQHSSNVAV